MELRDGLGRGGVLDTRMCVGCENHELAPSNGVVERRPFDDRKGDRGGRAQLGIADLL